MTDLVMPKLSDSMEQGTILSWLKASGDTVAIGDELLEIETDKSTVTYVAEAEGVLEILVAEGTTVAIGELIARVGASAQASTAPSSETPIGQSAVEVPAAAAAPVTGLIEHNGGADNGGSAPRSGATPLARRIAAAHGVTLEEVEGTGPLGRITRADVLSKAGLTSAPSPLPRVATPVPALAPRRAAPPPDASPGTELRQPTRVQQLIARRMAEAKATIPHFQVQTEVVMDAAARLRGEFKALAGEGDPVPSFNDFIVKAAALALREHPLANGSYTDAGFLLHEAVNVGIAVAADGVLSVPTVFEADRKSLGQIARETRALAARVRTGEIAPAELEGGTFTVSNLGMFGMTAITPVINAPEAAILGVGAIRDTLARVEGEIVDRALLTLTLSCDHRILYGADAARFLARIRELLEAPLKLVL